MRLDDSIDRNDRPARVLFVDDEPLVIRSLRRTLTGRRVPWEIHFCETGESALAHLGREPFDVIVSDMNMPGMGGAALLARVQEEHPDMARVILSGIADPKQVFQTVPVAHLALTKPFDPLGLIGAISRGIELRALLLRPALRAALGTDGRLPTPPPVYAAITRALAREQSSVWEIMDILGEHAAVSSRLGRLASYAPSDTVRPRARLLSYVAGIEPPVLRSLVLLAEIAETVGLEEIADQTFSVEAFERRSIRTAHLAARIVGRRGAMERAFVAGLLQDVGELVLAARMPGELAGIRERCARDGVSLEEAERSILGFSHAEVGAWLLGLFGFPLEMIEAVLGQPEPGENESGGLDVGKAAYVASVLSRDSDAPVGPGITKGLDPERLGRAPDPGRLEQWRRAARQLTGRAMA
jgi:CheY-like chemotaxis protein